MDNYGDGNTPVVGSQIAAFQGHHQKPWTITEREFCNNVHKVCPALLAFTLTRIPSLTGHCSSYAEQPPCGDEQELAGLHASGPLCSAVPPGIALDARACGCLSVSGNLLDGHEPAVPCLGTHEEVGGASDCGSPTGITHRYKALACNKWKHSNQKYSVTSIKQSLVLVMCQA